jgi:hypothetical protein
MMTLRVAWCSQVEHGRDSRPRIFSTPLAGHTKCRHHSGTDAADQWPSYLPCRDRDDRLNF